MHSASACAAIFSTFNFSIYNSNLSQFFSELLVLFTAILWRKLPENIPCNQRGKKLPELIVENDNNGDQHNQNLIFLHNEK